MIFTVPDNFEGSCVLNTLKKALWKGMTISICDPDLYAPDVKMAIKRGILVPKGEKYDEKQANISHNATIVNKTNKILILGEVSLNPKSFLIVKKAFLTSSVVQAAEKNGLISILFDKNKIKEKGAIESLKEEVEDKKDSIAEEKKEIEKVEKTDEKTTYVAPKTGEDREVTPVVWNFRDQDVEEAESISKSIEAINIDEPEVEDFEDEKIEVQKIVVKKKRVAKKKKASKKKVSKKKVSKKRSNKTTIKKKEKATKKEKVNLIEPVGEKKLPKTQIDAALELDSRGNPLGKASDPLQHLLDSLEGSEEIFFVDDEQNLERYEKRTDMD